jgi:hypothetical protein
MVDFISGLKHKMGDKSIHIIADTDATLEHWKDALVHFMKHVGQVEDQAKAHIEAKAKAEAEAIAKTPAHVTDEVKPE